MFFISSTAYPQFNPKKLPLPGNLLKNSYLPNRYGSICVIFGYDTVIVIVTLIYKVVGIKYITLNLTACLYPMLHIVCSVRDEGPFLHHYQKYGKILL